MKILKDVIIAAMVLVFSGTVLATADTQSSLSSTASDQDDFFIVTKNNVPTVKAALNNHTASSHVAKKSGTKLSSKQAVSKIKVALNQAIQRSYHQAHRKISLHARTVANKAKHIVVSNKHIAKIKIAKTKHKTHVRIANRKNTSKVAKIALNHHAKHQAKNIATVDI